MAVSFANDILPFLYPYRAQMLWRLDLTKYEDVKLNASIIYDQISAVPAGMPPAPFPPFSSEFISNFNSWITEGYPE